MNRLKRNLYCLAVGVLALAGTTDRIQAQTFITDSYTNSFDKGGNTEPFAGSGSVTSWIYWYNVPGGNTPMTNDVTMDAGGDPNSGSLRVHSPFTNATQNVFFGTFGNGGAYDFGTRADMSKYTNITFDLHVDPSMIPNGSGDFGNINVGMINASYGYQNFGTVTIPGDATNGWVHFSVNVDQLQANLTSVPGIAFGYNSYSGYPFTTMVFWIDNVTLHLNPGPPPPPPTITALDPAGTPGLQVIMGGADQWQRDAIVTPADMTSLFWAGNGSTPVTYSFTIADFPDRVVHEGFEAHMFLVNGATTDGFNQTYGGCDWNVPDLVVMSLLSDTNGGFGCQFQFKTNLPNANPPDNPVHRPGRLISPTAVGTWSVTFVNDTNVTMNGPGGISTNFTIPIEAVQNNFSPSASFIQFGFHKNDDENNGHNNGVSGTFGSVSKTGGASVFNDPLNGATLTNLYAWRKTSQAYVQYVGPSTKWDMVWTLPAGGFGPQVAGDVTGPYLDLTPSATYQAAGVTHAYVDAASIPAGNAAYFRLVKREFTQLQVLLPGQTNAPGTALGYVGTPTPISLAAQGLNPTTVTVNACDSSWNIIVGNTDLIHLTTTDTGAFLPTDLNMVNGTATFSEDNGILFQSQGSWTVSAQDLSSQTVTDIATSASVTVGP